MATEENLKTSYKYALKTIRELGTPNPYDAYTSRVPVMVKYLDRIGYQVSDLSKLNIIHVTGTKGKGSTCTFCEHILRQYGLKTGAFTSPHVVSLRERFCIDGTPIPEDIFCQHFSNIHDKFTKANEDLPDSFAFMTLMAFDIFLQQNVDVMILEVGIGGEYDCTNVIDAPVVCGVTSIHLDHVDKLGNSVKSIAWHKSGIFKPGAPAVTAPQTDDILSVLHSRAKERKTTLFLAPSLDSYETNGLPIKLGLAGVVQKINASIALLLCRLWMEAMKQDTAVPDNGLSHQCMLQEYRQTTSTKIKTEAAERVTSSFQLESNDDQLETSSSSFSSTQQGTTLNKRQQFVLTAYELKGLAISTRQGRTQMIRRPGVTYFLDTAHTDISIQAFADWLVEETEAHRKKTSGHVAQILVFHFAAWRDVSKSFLILKKLPFDVALFSPYSDEKEESFVESLFTNISYEDQMQSSLDEHKLWEEADERNNVPRINENHIHEKIVQGERAQEGADNLLFRERRPAPSVVVPTLKQALILATGGRDPHISDEGSCVMQQMSALYPDINVIVQRADHIQIMIAGCHKIIGHSLALLCNH